LVKICFVFIHGPNLGTTFKEQYNEDHSYQMQLAFSILAI